MDKRFGLRVFPQPMPKTPAGRFLLLYDLTTPIVDAETGETYAPILTPEEGLRLMDMPEDIAPTADFDAANGTRKTRWILYSGEFVTPDVMDNLDREHRAAAWALTKMADLPPPVRKSLEAYLVAIRRLVATSDRDPK